jgi:NAD-specific glutamate dehydrogenase
MSESRTPAVDDLLQHVDAQVVAARGEGMALVPRYLHDVPPEDLRMRRADDLVGMLLAHLDLAASRPDGSFTLQVFTPSVDEHGWSTGHTVVQIVIEDMPFLVDSVMAALTSGGHAVHEVIHPVLEVRRDVTGRLQEVLPSEPRQVRLGDDHRRESWIHVEIGRETDPEDVAEIEVTLRAVLRDVRDAVEDYPKMRQRALEAADAILRQALPVPDQEVVDAEELLRWLADDHFTFLGYRQYRLDVVDGQDVLRPVTGTGLGILRADRAMSRGFATLPPASRSKAREKRLLVLTKANSRATVHRAVYMDYVGVKVFDEAGEVVGERRFLGLLASSAYYDSVLRVPLLREKVRRVMVAAGYAPGSHNAKDLLHVMETFPRDELFQTPESFLVDVARAVVGLQDRGRLRLFVRPDAYGRFLSCLVYLPRDRYNTDVRLTVQDVLLRATGGQTIDYTAQVGESLLARLHVVIRMPPGTSLPALDLPQLQAEITAAIRDWADDFSAALVEAVGEEEAARLAHRYRGAFSEGYREDFSPRMAVADVLALERLPEHGPGLAVALYHPPALASTQRRFKIYRSGAPLALTEVLPLLTALGVDVDDEWPYDVTRAGEPTAYLYDFGLRVPASGMVSGSDVRERFEAAFLAVWHGEAENDGFNALVLGAGLSHRQCAVLRGYAKYLEIWVCSPRVEGVHLRFGKVARGGLRWSDRREDFRTEVLGLVKAQAVKNSVIVPVGPRAASSSSSRRDQRPREAWLPRRRAYYRMFINGRCWTSPTTAGDTVEVIPRARWCATTDDDPYLVVAADKGTATFSDIANGVAARVRLLAGGRLRLRRVRRLRPQGAWASPPKVPGSRSAPLPGARHRQPETQDFTAVGIGDMSGDVFGNGDAALAAHPAGRRLRPPAHLPRPRPGPGRLLRRARAPVRPAALELGGLRPDLVSSGGGVSPRSRSRSRSASEVRAALGIDGVGRHA